MVLKVYIFAHVALENYYYIKYKYQIIVQINEMKLLIEKIRLVYKIKRHRKLAKTFSEILCPTLSGKVVHVLLIDWIMGFDS